MAPKKIWTKVYLISAIITLLIIVIIASLLISDSDMPSTVVSSPEPTPTALSETETPPTPTPPILTFPAPRPRPIPRPISLPEDALIAKAREQFEEGKIAFSPPEEMATGKTETLEARITYQGQNDSLVQGLRGRGQAIVEQLKVSFRMKVALVAANNTFDITPLTPQEVRLLDRQEPFSSWKWSVTPKKSGIHEIHLTAEAITQLPELGERSLYVKTFDYTIRVKVTKESVLDWVGQYWQYILGSMVIPLAGWLWNLYNKRKEKSENEPPEPPRIITP
jgi:hypothetical protein